MRAQALCGFLVIVLLVVEAVVCQEINSTKYHRHRGSDRRHHRHGANRTGVVSNAPVELAEKDKYYEDAGSDDDDYTYDETYDGYQNDTGADEDEENKFIESSDSGIVLDHVDFVMLRLKHISMRTSDNITELLTLQKKEFKVNSHYKSGWEAAIKLFNDSQRDKIYNNTSKYSIIQKVPVEYHIALIAYTLGTPSMYAEFNKDTREICSGNHIDNYQWKSYFKLLQLAVETLGTQEARWVDNRKFLYRGASRRFSLKEGQVLAFQHFISTSSSLISAEVFAGETLFEFQGLYNGTAMAIWDHSFFEHEEEVLFSPLQVFRVDSIHVGSHYTRYVLVKHQLPLPCDDKTSDDEKDGVSRQENINALHSRSGAHRGKLEFAVGFLAMVLGLVACHVN